MAKWRTLQTWQVEVDAEGETPWQCPRVLITGGCGFIGGTITQQLVMTMGPTVRVRVLDSMPPKEPVPGVTYIRGDIRCARSVDLQSRGGVGGRV